MRERGKTGALASQNGLEDAELASSVNLLVMLRRVPPAGKTVPRGGGLAARTSAVLTLPDGGTVDTSEGERMGDEVVWLDEVDRTWVASVGGKAANLGELTRIDGVDVPPGFCVTTDAFVRVVARAPSFDRRIDELSALAPDDRGAIGGLAAGLRSEIEAIPVPDDLAAAITAALARIGEGVPCAVRSSATAEDLATASAAGQQDSYLNVVGAAQVIEAVRRCWASLFTERAVTYRLRNGIDQRSARMAVVVQQLVVADVAGILFTADPVTGDRTVSTIDAGFGLGEALVSGLVDPDTFRVRGGEVVDRTVSSKDVAVVAAPTGGTRQVPIESDRRGLPSLSDEEAVQLAEVGRRIEAHLGAPQDIEWCRSGGGLHVLQSRPITTLFPVPEAGDDEHHVYVSVGHQQMMTDPIKPLGLSVWQMTTPRPMAEAGGRLWVDVTQLLAAPAGRAGLLGALGRSDPLIGDALRTVVERDGFLPTLPDDAPVVLPPGAGPAGADAEPIETDPAVVDELIERSRAALAETERVVGAASGEDVLDAIERDLQELRSIQFDARNLQAIMAGMEAAWWLNDELEQRLGERNAADTLTQSVPNNVTAEMGLDLLDVADAVRPHPDVVSFLERIEHAGDPTFLDRLDEVEGGAEAGAAIRSYLDRYGMRCVGEIDITRPRWSERPDALLPAILGNVRRFSPGEGERRFERGRAEAAAKAADVLSRLEALPDGPAKAEEAGRMIDRVRTFAGYREHPKYWMISRYWVYKRALLREADRLVEAGVLDAAEDVHFLRFEELRDVLRTGRVDRELIARRGEAYRSFAALTPPRVLTSDGEAVAASYRRDDVPDGALVGLAVSAGTVEGRARVIHDMAEAEVEAGDILVTTSTDPSWSPLFVAVAGLVTEVGGLMTHGAVIAREYGLPAVVGVQGATRLIHDGGRIRVHGTEGYVELLDG